MTAITPPDGTQTAEPHLGDGEMGPAAAATDASPAATEAVQKVETGSADPKATGSHMQGAAPGNKGASVLAAQPVTVEQLLPAAGISDSPHGSTHKDTDMDMREENAGKTAVVVAEPAAAITAEAATADGQEQRAEDMDKGLDPHSQAVVVEEEVQARQPLLQLIWTSRGRSGAPTAVIDTDMGIAAQLGEDTADLPQGMATNETDSGVEMAGAMDEDTDTTAPQGAARDETHASDQPSGSADLTAKKIPTTERGVGSWVPGVKWMGGDEVMGGAAWETQQMLLEDRVGGCQVTSAGEASPSGKRDHACSKGSEDQAAAASLAMDDQDPGERSLHLEGRWTFGIEPNASF